MLRSGVGRAVMGVAAVVAGFALLVAAPAAVPHEGGHDDLQLAGDAQTELVLDAAASGGVVGGASTPDGDGYWIAYGDGTVQAVGDADWFGDASDLPLNGPVQGMASTPSGEGYWLVAFDGGVFSYGDAEFYGSMGGARLNAPIFSIAPSPTGDGYWLVAFDGGIFAFGDAAFFGSMGGTRLNAPINGILSTPATAGYLMVASDGGVFSFAPQGVEPAFFGSLGGTGVQDVVGLAATPSNQGYWILRSNGVIAGFGDAEDLGEERARNGNTAVGIVSNPTRQGYRVIYSDGSTAAFGRAPGGRRDSDPVPAPTPTAPPTTAPAPTTPTPPVDLPHPVGSGLYPPNGEVDYFIVDGDNTPGRYPACKPIEYVTDFSSAPPGSREVLADVLAEISAAGGFEFVFAGEVDADFASWRDNSSVGNAFRPLLFTWKNGNEHPFGGAVGQGGSTARFGRLADGGSGWVLVSGAAVFRADVDYERLGSSQRAVVLHEILHVLGMDHVGRTSEVMYPSLTSLDRMGPGDTWGVHQVGRGTPCRDLAEGHRWADVG
ncbi:MAG: hypothetical protein AAGD18_07035 [Actinomycetota bacterium]